jgi:hypothetical protein
MRDALLKDEQELVDKKEIGGSKTPHSPRRAVKRGLCLQMANEGKWESV